MSSRLAFLMAIATMASMPMLSVAKATTIAGDYYEEEVSVSCETTAACHMSFPVLPSSTSGLFLNLHEVNCMAVAGQPAIGARIYISDNGTNARRPHHFEITAQRSDNGTMYFSEPVNLKVTGGPPRQLRMWVQFKAASDVSLKCVLVGTLSST